MDRKHLIAAVLMIVAVITLFSTTVAAKDFIIQNATGSPILVANGTTGNVGIGTLGPGVGLDVSGDAGITGDLNMNSGDITNLNELPGFFAGDAGAGSCQSGEAVKAVYPNGSYICANITSTSEDVFVDESGDTMTGPLSMSDNPIRNISSLSVNTPLSDGNISNSLTITGGTVDTSTLSGTVTNDIRTGFLTTSTELSDGNISDSITVQTSGLVGTITNDVRTDFLSTTTALSDGNISDSISIGSGGSINADAIDSGTLADARFSAYSDLGTEGYLDNNAAGDLLTRTQLDGRFINEGQTDAVDNNVLNNSAAFTMSGLTSTGDVQVQGDLDVWGNITNTDVQNLNINGSLLPPAEYDNTFDIGSTSRRWADLYLGGSASIDNGLTVSAGTVSLPIGAIDNTELANSDITIDVSGPLTGGGSVSLGNTASIGFNDIFLNESGDTLSGDLSFANGYRAIELLDPVNPQDAATKSYVDTVGEGANQTLEEVLQKGNSAGIYSIDMNNQNIRNINALSVGQPLSDGNISNTLTITGGTVDTSTLDGTVTNDVNAFVSVTDPLNSGNISTDAITATELANNAVDTAAIQTAAVTNQKIAADSINTTQIVNGEVGAADIASGAITAGGTELDVSVAGNQLSLSGGALNVDQGEGSGLNADQLDGQNSSYFKQDLADVLNQGNTASQNIDLQDNNLTDVRGIDGAGDSVDVNDELNMNQNNISDAKRVDFGNGNELVRSGTDLCLGDECTG